MKPRRFACRLGIFTICALAFAGCMRNSPAVWSGEVGRATIDGSLYEVRYTATRAEATRLSTEWNFNKDVMRDRAVRAIEQVSNCVVDRSSVRGDVAFAKVSIACAPEPSPAGALGE